MCKVGSADKMKWGNLVPTRYLNGFCKFLSFLIQDQVLIQGDSFYIFCIVYLMLIIIISCSDSEKKEDVGDKRAE